MKFLRNLLAAILGTMIAWGLLFFLFAGIGAAMGSKEKVVVKPSSVLTLKLSGDVKDYVPKSDNPFDQIFKDVNPQFQLSEVLTAIDNAMTDDNIKGISIELDQSRIGMAQLQALRDKLIEFKSSGKFIGAFADSYSQKSYYLSSVADSIFINPVGILEFKGLTSEKLYFKDFQEKYGVKMEVIRHGKYKSAMEGFISDKMSDANREQTLSFLSSIWGEFLEDIGQSRGKSVDELNKVADNLGTKTNALAVDNHMIDGVLYIDQYRDKLVSWSGVESMDDLNMITMKHYLKSGKGRNASSASDKVAVLYAQGEIKYGKGDETFIGQEAMIKAIRKIKKDKKIKALVLRVNSPGGSGLASDIILRELELLKQEKPLVVSMGNLAASGGYYIACKADKIYAEPTTITGSIGVFGAMPNVNGLAKNMGINAEQVTTNKAPGYSIFEPMNQAFHDEMKGMIDNFYQIFITHVAEGRNMTKEAVDAVAQGRVWTGKEAQDIGLVDELGSLNDAVSHAASIAGLDSYKTTAYPRYKKDIEDVFKGNPFMTSKADMLKETLGEENYQIYQTIENFKQMEGVQARMPYELVIR
ncbi:MAG: signal peptide peptidase SppA [Flavobacteriia bacterium]|nr:MAG: signal peptide peptidase SppA [Flavobacteriia bacterium]